MNLKLLLWRLSAVIIELFQSNKNVAFPSYVKVLNDFVLKRTEE